MVFNDYRPVIKHSTDGWDTIIVFFRLWVKMIIEEPDAQYLQKHGDMIYRNGDIIERAQGYLIEIEELDKIVDDVIHGRI